MVPTQGADSRKGKFSAYPDYPLMTGANGSESQDATEGVFDWERRRPAGKALRNKIAAILHTCRRDAGAPSGRFP